MSIIIPTMEPPNSPRHRPEQDGPTIAINACGATADGRLSTAAIQKAIDQVDTAGGGTVIVPRGTWRTGALRLVSGLTLKLEEGAILQGSGDWRDYGSGAWREAILTGVALRGLRICGPGIIDGCDCFNPAGEGGKRGPHGIWLDRCIDVKISGITLRNLGNWGFAIWSSCDLTFDSIAVQGGHDGIDLQNCHRIDIRNCKFETGDDCLAGPGNSDIHIHDTYFNSSCNNIRLSCERMYINRCTFVGPGRYEHRFTGGRRNTLAAIVHFSPPERGYRGFTPHSEQWLVEDCTVTGVDTLFEYDNGHAWQDGRGVGTIVFRRLCCTGFCAPIFAHCSMRSRGEYRRECRLYFEDCLLEPRPGCEDCGFFDLRRHGSLSLRRVTLRNNGSTRPLRTLDGGPVEIEGLTIEPRQVTPAATVDEAMRGVSTFVFPTPPLGDDFSFPPVDGFPQLNGIPACGRIRDGQVRGLIYHLGDKEALLLWSRQPASVDIRGLLHSAEYRGGEAIDMPRPKLDTSPDRSAQLSLRLDRNPILVAGVGLEIAAE